MNRKNLGAAALCIPALAILAVLAAPEMGTLAYTTNGVSHAGGTAAYKINPNFLDASAGSTQDQIDALKAGADEWNNRGQANFQFQYTGTTTIDSIAYDGTNIVYYSDTDGGGALAVCYWWSIGSTLMQFDIEFYDRDGSWDFDWANNPTGGQFDIQSVACHEFGHALGLSHSAVSSATMFPSVSAGSTGNRSIAVDDILGIQSLYGQSTPAPPALTEVVPASGWIDGGDTVQVLGTDLPSSGFVVTFNGVPASSAVWVDATRIDCTVPAGSIAGAVDVELTVGIESTLLQDGFSYDMIRLTGALNPGQTAVLECVNPNDANFWYQGVISEGNAGVDLSLATPGDNRVIPVTYDWTAYYSQVDDILFDLPYFDQMRGFWDGTGHCQFLFTMPDIPQAYGLTFHFCVLTGDLSAPSSIRTISNGASGTYQ